MKVREIVRAVEKFGAGVMKLGMPMIVDLGEGEHVRIENEGRALQINILKEGVGRAHSPGVIRLERVSISGGNVWEVVNSGANKGYGPLLYDIGMEVVCNVVGIWGLCRIHQ